MQTPDGELHGFDELKDALAEAQRLEDETGKRHPVFTKGQIVTINGGKWKVMQLLKRHRMVLRAEPY